MKKNKVISRLVLFLSIISFIMFAFLAIIICKDIYNKNQKKNEMKSAAGSVYSQDELEELLKNAENTGKEGVLSSVKESLENGESVLDVLKDIYPNYIIVASNGKYNWVPINENLKKHDYSMDNLKVDDSGFLSYVDNNGDVISKKGIDVSSHQGDIDWASVKNDGISFAFIRAVYRGYGTGKIVVDEKCLENIQAAQAVGIKVGVYVFSQAVSEDEAREEADSVLVLLDGINLDLPIVFDVEKLPAKTARMNNLSIDERTDVTLAFLEEIKNFNKDVMIYHNTEMGAMLIDLTRLEQYDKWFAAYTNEIYWPYAFKIWQYSEKGRVNGINGNVDLDIWIE